jgi:ubiquinone/menaquinone biosynthesis C-methylase UbiE
MMNKIKLLPQEDLIKTGPVDHADWNYKAFIRQIQRKRFRLCMKLIQNAKYEKLLEIGYGSGIFLPALSAVASGLYGLDIHQKNKEVEKVLLKHKIKANLMSGSAVKIPFDNNYFDLIISISAVEFINELDEACKEIKRVMKKDGVFIVITPGHSSILDLGLKIITKQSARLDYENRRKYIISTLLKYFKVEKKITFPGHSVPSLNLYYALKLIKPEKQISSNNTES